LASSAAIDASACPSLPPPLAEVIGDDELDLEAEALR